MSSQQLARLLLSIAMFVLIIASAPVSRSSDVLLISGPNARSSNSTKLGVAAEFYGLQMTSLTVNSNGDNSRVRAAVEDNSTLGVVIEESALAYLDRGIFLKALDRKSFQTVPILILGEEAAEADPLLERWTSQSVARCKSVNGSANRTYLFGAVEGLTAELSNVEVPLVEKETQYFSLDVVGFARRVSSIRDSQTVFPVFVESKGEIQKVFVACGEREQPRFADNSDIVSSFLSVAPELMFVRYCAGERGWHSLHHYANLTIDDPWLRQPYGYLDYQKLSVEMEKHHFHTTIAFIPWNYDRSEIEVASLFNKHPDQFSIAIHGNNHDHKEFTDYQSRPLNNQIRDLEQALTRMDVLRARTGISYDKVMIFPHSIAPQATLRELKGHNYWATVNGSNIPQSEAPPSSPSFFLRPVTVSFEGVPSLSRLSTTASVPDSYIAVNQFLGNPLLFYDHSSLFSKGIQAFDDVADKVNSNETQTRWCSLGEVVKHLYLVRAQNESTYDLLALSSTFAVENTTPRDATFAIQKPERGEYPIDSVTVDGQTAEYHLTDGRLEMAMKVPSGGVRNVVVHYAEASRASAISPAHDSITVYGLRMASDFRDIYIERSELGRGIIAFYYKHSLTPLRVLGCALLILIGGIGVSLWVVLYLFVAKHRSAPLSTQSA